MAVIAARGGSKGIIRKNLKPLAGRPLLSWTIEAARRSAFLDSVILSSEDSEINELGSKLGCSVPFVRPPELALDDTPSDAVVKHAIDWCERSGKVYSWVLLLQPTSPFRSHQDIDDCIKQCLETNKTSMVSVTESKGFYWTYKIDQEGSLEELVQGVSPRRRQDLPPTYTLNGAIYLARMDVYRERGTFIGPNTGAFVMPQKASIDIDSPLDFEIAEVIARHTLEYSSK